MPHGRRLGGYGSAIGLLAIWALTSACSTPSQSKRAVASYDRFSGRLLQLGADQNGDGRLDQWTYIDATRPLRGEADTDNDGRIDTWEYFGAGATLVMIGTSTKNDGIEDRWTWVAATPAGESQVGISRNRDRQIDRREYFVGTALNRAEEDTNADGRTDKWERYEGAILREAAFDTSVAQGRPDRRLLYDARGNFEAIEFDAEGDGTFVRLAGQAAIRKAGVQE
jgi:hypothetical protein